MGKVSVGKLTLGVSLCAFGMAMLADRFLGSTWFSRLVTYWPVFVIMLGIESILLARRHDVRLGWGYVILLALVLVVAWGYDQGYDVIKFDLGEFGLGAVSPPCERSVTVRESLAGIHTLVIDTPGSVRVSGTSSATELKAEFQVSVRASTRTQAQSAASRWAPRIRAEGGTLTLTAEKPDISPVSFSASCELEIPPAMNLRIRTVSGAVTVEGVEGSFDVTTVSGEVTLQGRADSIRVRTVSGDVEARVEPSTTSVDVSTVSGDVDLELGSGAGGYFRIDTTSGTITAPEGLQRRQSPGRSVAEGSIGTGTCRVTVETVSGSVKVR